MRSFEVARRISALHSVREVVRVMRTLASAQIRLVSGRLAHVRLYREVVDDLMERFVPEKIGALTDASTVVVLGSDRGLCGGFHERIAAAAASRLIARRNARLIVVGTRTAEALERRGLAPAEVLAAPGGVERAGALLRALALRLEDELARGGLRSVEMVGAVFERVGRYRTATRQLLPPPPPRAPRPPLFHYAERDALAAATSGEYVFISLTAAILETLAAENGARLAAMETASGNVDEALERARRELHRRRQEEITAEVLEVATGALATEQTDTA